MGYEVHDNEYQDPIVPYIYVCNAFAGHYQEAVFFWWLLQLQQVVLGWNILDDVVPW
jgi:hypothetical protein